MSRQLATAILTIANGQTKSGSLQSYWDSTKAGKIALDHCAIIAIKGPAALTGTVTVQVAHTEPSVDGDFVNHQYLGTDITVAAAKSNSFPAPAAKDLRLISGSAEGAARSFYVTLQEDIG